MHKHTARLPACSAVAGIADAAEALDNRAPSRRYARPGGKRERQSIAHMNA
jgi:hypothetical protein